MPARRRTGSNNSISMSNPGRPVLSPLSDDVNYLLKRKRNNVAVKKTRARQKVAANQRKRNIEDLKDHNKELEGQIKEKKAHIKYLKDLLMTAQDATQKEAIKKLVEEPDTDSDMSDLEETEDLDTAC